MFTGQWVASIDMAANEEANENVIVKMSESFTEQAGQVSVLRSGTVRTVKRLNRNQDPIFRITLHVAGIICVMCCFTL